MRVIDLMTADVVTVQPHTLLFRGCAIRGGSSQGNMF